MFQRVGSAYATRMIASPGLDASRGTKDGEHLKWLSVFHLMGAGVAALGLLVCIGQYAVLESLIPSREAWGDRSSIPILLSRLVFLALGVSSLGMVVVNLLSARFIRDRRHRTFSMAVAALNCIQVPLGTALGVATLVVLMRDSVRELYGVGES